MKQEKMSTACIASAYEDKGGRVGVTGAEIRRTRPLRRPAIRADLPPGWLTISRHAACELCTREQVALIDIAHRITDFGHQSRQAGWRCAIAGALHTNPAWQSAPPEAWSQGHLQTAAHKIYYLYILCEARHVSECR